MGNLFSRIVWYANVMLCITTREINPVFKTYFNFLSLRLKLYYNECIDNVISTKSVDYIKSNEDFAQRDIESFHILLNYYTHGKLLQSLVKKSVHIFKFLGIPSRILHKCVECLFILSLNIIDSIHAKLSCLFSF